MSHVCNLQGARGHYSDDRERREAKHQPRACLDLWQLGGSLAVSFGALRAPDPLCETQPSPAVTLAGAQRINFSRSGTAKSTLG
jgi:hypothetical protein